MVDAGIKQGVIPAGQRNRAIAGLLPLARASLTDDAANAQLVAIEDAYGYRPPTPGTAGLPEGFESFTFGGETTVYVNEPVLDDFGRQVGTKPRVIASMPATTGAGGFSQAELKDLEAAAVAADKAGDTTLAAKYRARIQQELLKGAGGGGFTGDYKNWQAAFDLGIIDEPTFKQGILTGLQKAGGAGGVEQGYLDLARQKFSQLELPQFEQEKLKTQIQAARTAQPLTYLSLLRGSPQQYVGLGQFAPTLAQGGGAAAGGIPNMSANPGGGYGVDMSGQAQGGGGVPMPPSMAAIQRGDPIKLAGLPAGEGTTPSYLRFEGPQAQRNLTPFELAANTEAREFQGIPEAEQEYQRAIFRRGVGSGLRFGGYGGSLRG